MKTVHFQYRIKELDDGTFIGQQRSVKRGFFRLGKTEWTDIHMGGPLDCRLKVMQEHISPLMGLEAMLGRKVEYTEYL